MKYPIIRSRRLRETPGIRKMVKETGFSVDELIYPVFIIEGRDVKNPVSSMPGIFQLSMDKVIAEIAEARELGISYFLIFGIPDKKDAEGSEAYSEDGIVQRTLRSIKDKFPDVYLITDVCLCEYTDHGHCGIVRDGEILNDPTLDILGKIALTHAEAGADMVAPSDMMDGRVGAIREYMDNFHFHHTPIMSYTAKYSSKFYGPFREAAQSSPQFGDRNSYQMDPANVREAVREAELDIEEGADILMVKPALAYLDVIKSLKERYNYPIAAYSVSGEYSMIKAAAEKGWLDEKSVVPEVLTGIKRAGADIIITYHAVDVARWLQE